MNVYDFDDTIYDGDSTFDFILYCWKNVPGTRRNIPRSLWFGLLYGIHVVPKLTFKQKVYHMFTWVEDMDALVEQFIDSHLDRIKPWYYDQQKPDDLVISASPEFIIQRFCKKIGISYAMASPVDPKTGSCPVNCHGEEKVKRFYEAYPDGVIEEFYSDSYSDSPLANISKQAFLVKGNKRTPWRKTS